MSGITCENCHSFKICSTLSQFCRQLLFSTNINVNEVRPVLVSALAANCELFVDQRKFERDRKSMAAGPDA